LTNTERYRLLEEKTVQYNCVHFIAEDPVSIPHMFTKNPDIEISGFFAAMLAWGIRKTIINKCRALFELMDWQPHDFILNHSARDAQKLLHFKHRTFNGTDLAYFLEWLKWYYQNNDSLQDAFSMHMAPDDVNTEKGLTGFHNLFFSLPESPNRTRKHIATPERGSTCKRLNMYLRWMVRQDNTGVDFGIWHKIKPAQLVCPVDLHVERVARKLGLITTPRVNWKGAVELTEKLKKLDPVDPVKYDFALFGLGIMENYSKAAN
jgi:uncharacterized protein (TIGR02757 family)